MSEDNTPLLRRMQSDIGEVRKDVGKMSTQMAALVATLEERHLSQSKNILDLESTVYGNNAPGLKTDVVVLKTETRIFRRYIKAIWTLAVGVFVSLVTALFGWIKG